MVPLEDLEKAVKKVEFLEEQLSLLREKLSLLESGKVPKVSVGPNPVSPQGSVPGATTPTMAAHVPQPVETKPPP